VHATAVYVEPYFVVATSCTRLLQHKWDSKHLENGNSDQSRKWLIGLL